VDGLPFNWISPAAVARVQAPLACRARPPPRTFAAADRVLYPGGQTEEDVQMQTRVSAIDEWLDRVRGEYLEMPGLRLTFAQAARFWSLDRGTCARVLDALVKARFLVVTAEGLYSRAGSLREEESVFVGHLLTTVTAERGGPPLTRGRRDARRRYEFRSATSAGGRVLPTKRSGTARTAAAPGGGRVRAAADRRSDRPERRRDRC
jgi:hypothetical protein